MLIENNRREPGETYILDEDNAISAGSTETTATATAATTGTAAAVEAAISAVLTDTTTYPITAGTTRSITDYTVEFGARVTDCSGCVLLCNMETIGGTTVTTDTKR
jgi:hypothetical protein